MGSAAFLLGMTVFILTWFVTNNLWGFDPQYLVLNLLFSTMSSYAAPLIMLAQNRGAARDQVVVDVDRANNRRDRSEMEHLTGQIIQLRKSLGDLPTRGFVRDEVSATGPELRQLRQLYLERRTRP